MSFPNYRSDFFDAAGGSVASTAIRIKTDFKEAAAYITGIGGSELTQDAVPGLKTGLSLFGPK